MHLELFELVNAEGVSMSPFVWRSRCSLLYKGLDWTAVGMGFAEERDFKSFPTLRHEGALICGSWDIAEYLEERFIDRPRIFGDGEEGRAMAWFVSNWVDSQVMPVVFRSIVADIHDAARPEDRDYFRRQKEERLGDTLENSQARQRAKGNRLSGLLEPARRQFRQHDFFSPHGPLYPDFCLFAMFQWARIASDYPFLEDDDPVSAWLERMDRWLDRAQTVQGLRAQG